MKIIYAVITGLILLILATIGVQNPTLLTIRFLDWQTGVLPLWVIIVAAFVMGMLLVALVTLPGRIGRFRMTRRLQHQLDTTAGAAHTHAVMPPVDRDHHASVL